MWGFIICLFRETGITTPIYQHFIYVESGIRKRKRKLVKVENIHRDREERSIMRKKKGRR